MKSSTGEYFVGLDHVRALAAFLVFTWHFSHFNDGHLTSSPVFPFSIFLEGHVGVALFMTLSGYLFAKLLNGRRIIFSAFIWNRALRLFPLLIVAFLIEGLMRWNGGSPMQPYLGQLLRGFVFPVWPNGGWSIAVELHFYFILPLLLRASENRPQMILLVVLVFLLGRYIYWREFGQVQTLAYWTIVGGIDQFAFGIFAFNCRGLIRGKHALAAIVCVLVLAFIWYFDTLGGFYGIGGYPTRNPIWIVYPTIVGAGFAFLVAWYDGSFKFRNQGLSGLVAKIGACSYSIYLLHFFVVFDVASFVDENLFALTDPLVTTGASVLTFLAFTPVAYASFKFIELPPMAWKLPYQAEDTGLARLQS